MYKSSFCLNDSSLRTLYYIALSLLRERLSFHLPIKSQKINYTSETVCKNNAEE